MSSPTSSAPLNRNTFGPSVLDNRTGIEIRRASTASAPELLRIMHAAFEEYRGRLVPAASALSETLSHVVEAIENGGAFMALYAGEAAGCCRYRVLPDHAYAERVAVLPEHRGKGIAAALMRAFEREVLARQLSEARVRVRASVPSNLRLYENLGYRALSSRPYPSGTDFEIILGKPIHE